jgi:hypothetical protein
MNVRHGVLCALLGLMSMSQVAEAKKPGGKLFGGAKVETDSVSVGVTRVTLKDNGDMSMALLVQSKSDRDLYVDMKGFVLSAGGHELQRDAKMLASAKDTITKSKPKTINIEFKHVDASITEATLHLSSVFRLKSDKKDLTVPDMTLTAKGAGGAGSSSGSSGGGGDTPSSDSDSSSQ